MLRSFSSLVLVTAISLSLWQSDAHAQTLEVLGTARTNNRTESLVFRIPAHQARLSELRIRSGSLAVALAGIEIEFADGKLQRAVLQETLPPGYQSRPISVHPHGAVKRIFVTKRPGLHPGETVIQLLGKVER